MIKRWIKKSLVGSGVLRTLARNREKGAAILFYHSVMDDPRPQISCLGEIVHSTNVFRKQMEVLAREYSPVTLDDVLAFVAGKKDLPPRAVVVTFDDGYVDNLEIAAPILNHYGVPSICYVTVDCVENRRIPWPARLRHACLTTRKTQLAAPDSGYWSLATTEHRNDAFNKASEHCARLSGGAQENYVRSVELELEADSSSAGRLMMTWEQVRKFAKQGHAVGSHTMTHPNIAYVSQQEMQTELGESKAKLEKELGARVTHFAYPGPALRPNWSEQSVAISRTVGYQSAVTIEAGLVRRNDNPQTLRRIGPGPNVDALRWNLDCTFLGRRV